MTEIKKPPVTPKVTPITMPKFFGKKPPPAAAAKPAAPVTPVARPAEVAVKAEVKAEAKVEAPKPAAPKPAETAKEPARVVIHEHKPPKREAPPKPVSKMQKRIDAEQAAGRRALMRHKARG